MSRDNRLYVHDPFLRGMPDDDFARLDRLRQERGTSAPDFYRDVDAWFSNFAAKDKLLAFKIATHIEYYSPIAFSTRLFQLRIPIAQHLAETGADWTHVRLVVPDDLADSAERHAYDLIKAWPDMTGGRTIRMEEIGTKTAPSDVLVLFNDTHGTGNQLLRSVGAELAGKKAVAAIFVVAITIAEKALRRFRRELPGVNILPDTPALDARNIFTAAEYARIYELGMKVYPRHPLGYGSAGLLTAYYFQCPNNTIPLIWADGSNNQVDGRAYPWIPLHRYNPKRKLPTKKALLPRAEKERPSLLWEWNEEESAQIRQTIDSWELDDDSVYQTLDSWLTRFDRTEKQVVMELLRSVRFLNLSKVRQSIVQLRHNVMNDIKSNGGDTSDVLLVTTGESRPSTYHYVYEFMKAWKLSVEQICDVSELSADRVIDKTIVLFYHTRCSASHLKTNYGARLKELAPRKMYIAAYAMTESAQAEFLSEFGAGVTCISDPAALATVRSSMSPEMTESYVQVGKRLGFELSLDDLLTVYYFQCPRRASMLLWSPAMNDQQSRWAPLFPYTPVARW